MKHLLFWVMHYNITKKDIRQVKTKNFLSEYSWCVESQAAFPFEWQLSFYLYNRVQQSKYDSQVKKMTFFIKNLFLFCDSCIV